MASGECRFSPESNQQHRRAGHSHTRWRSPAPLRHRTAGQEGRRARHGKFMLQESDEQRHERRSVQCRGQTRPNVVADLLMIPALAEAIAFLVPETRRFVRVARGVVRPMAMILRGPLHLPRAIAPIPARQPECLRTQQRRAAKHGEQPKVWQRAVHAGLRCATEGASSSASFGCVRVYGRQERGLRGRRPSADRRRSGPAGRGP